METEKMKNAVNKIKMTDEMRERIVSGAVRAAEEPIKRTVRFRPALIAAAILCLCITGAFAAGRMGFFRDVKDWRGAVVGTVYEDATEEIAATAEASDGRLTVTVVFAEPDKAPYSEFDSLGIESFRIVDAKGRIVTEGGPVAGGEVTGGGAEISIPIDGLAGGEYKLIIDAFTGEAKADQPLPVYGKWECEFTV